MAAVRRSRRRSLAAGAAVVLVVLAALTAGGLRSGAAFTAQTSNPSNSFSTAASFCNGGTQTLTASRDSWVNAGAVTTNYGTATTMDVRIATLLTGLRRSLVGFDLPAIPAHCRLTSASLRLHLTTATSTRTINVSRADRAWTESTVNWNTGVAPTGTAVGLSSGTAAGARTWDVTTQVGQQYSGANNGFILTDSQESSLLLSATQTFATREATTTTQRPQLTLVFGP